MVEAFECLMEGVLQYERNEDSGPLVYQLSAKAMLGSHALRDKS